MTPVAAALRSVRPSMAPIKSGVALVMNAAAQGRWTLAAVEAAAAQTLQRLAEAFERAAQGGAEALPQTGLVLTCSHSATILRSLTLAVGQGKDLTAFALSWPHRAIDYGTRMAEALRHEGIEVDVVRPDRLFEAVEHAAVAMVGADRVLQNGSLVNGQPTLHLAQSIRGPVPLYVVCDTFKVDTDPNHHLEPTFNLVPAGLVMAYITEEGTFAPKDIGSKAPQVGDAGGLRHP